jgi:hypothetical protein
MSSITEKISPIIFIFRQIFSVAPKTGGWHSLSGGQPAPGAAAFARCVAGKFLVFFAFVRGYARCCIPCRR